MQKITQFNISTPRIEWLDYLKAFAILAVLIDHMAMLFPNLYFAPWIREFFYFNVPLFIFAGGLGATLSLNKRLDYSMGGIFKKIRYVFCMYMIASIPYMIFKSASFDLAAYWHNLLIFHASAAFYYILIYCELTIAAPTLYILLVKSQNSCWKLILFSLAILLLSYVFLRYTMLSPEITGLGRYLMGGPYLFVFWVGMSLMYHVTHDTYLLKKIKNNFRRITITIAVAGIVFLGLHEILQRTSTSSFWEDTSSIRLLWTGAITCGLMLLHPFLKYIIILTRLGKHTLFIYLYHMAVIHFFKFSVAKVQLEITYWLWGIIFICCIMMPIGLEFIFERIRRSFAETASGLYPQQEKS